MKGTHSAFHEYCGMEMENFVDSSSAGTQLIVCMRRSRVGGDGDAGRRAEEGEDAVRMRGRARDGALLRTQPDHIQRPPKFGARLVGGNTRRQSWTRPRKLRRVHNLIIKYY